MFKHALLERFELPSKTIDNKRYYTTPSGEKYPSVTTVIGHYSDKTWLYEWRKRVGDEKANAISSMAASRGTYVHAIFEKYLMNDETYLNGVMPTHKILFKSMQHILDKNVDEVYGVEHPLYSHRLRTAGKTDLIARYNGIRSIVDFKTSSHPKEEKDIEGYFLQSTCYALMTAEHTGINVPQIVIMIAVENHEPNVFIKNTIDYTSRVVKLFTNHKISTLYQ